MSQDKKFNIPFSIKLGNNLNLNLDSKDVMNLLGASKKAKKGLNDLKQKFEGDEELKQP